MKKALSILTLTTFLSFAVSLMAADKVVVIPLSSSNPHALAQLDIDSSGGFSIISNILKIELDVGPDGAAENIFSLLIGENSKGQVFKSDRENNPNFNAAANLLTNGTDDDFLFRKSLYGTGSASGTGNSETRWIKGGITGNYKPDFVGSRVDHVLIHIDTITLNSVSNPDWTNYTVGVRIIFMGYP